MYITYENLLFMKITIIEKVTFKNEMEHKKQIGNIDLDRRPSDS